MTEQFEETAACENLSSYLNELGKGLDEYLRFEHSDAMQNPEDWKAKLGLDLPHNGIGIDDVIAEIRSLLLPNASAIPNPGFSSFITTGASNSALLANLSALVSAPQRYSLTAFNYVEELSLNWMRDLFGLSKEMKGIYSSGGSTANLIALGAARQQVFEKIGIDPARDGVQMPCRIYASAACHHTVHRAAAVLGLGRNSVITVPTNAKGQMSAQALRKVLREDTESKDSSEFLQLAVVANAGTTETGAIDPLAEIAELTQEYELWLHVDGAYGLPGILDPETAHLFRGINQADSVSVDPHKWMGAPVGIGTTFVKDRSILFRAFTQGAASYFEGAFSDEDAQHSLDSMGLPYADFGVELSAPSRGVVVWAIIREIGKSGLQKRICRHNAMAKHIAERVKAHPDLELALEPSLSICCFRYAHKSITNLDDFNRSIHRQLIRNGRNMPSTTYFKNKFVIRPCFIGARTSWQYADDLLDEFIELAEQLKNKNQ